MRADDEMGRVVRRREEAPVFPTAVVCWSRQVGKHLEDTAVGERHTKISRRCPFGQLDDVGMLAVAHELLEELVAPGPVLVGIEPVFADTARRNAHVVVADQDGTLAHDSPRALDVERELADHTRTPVEDVSDLLAEAQVQRVGQPPSVGQRSSDERVNRGVDLVLRVVRPRATFA
jgi:hypothetical protein